MAKVRQVLGHVTVETAARQRKCHRKPKQHQVAQGERCLVVRDSSMGAKKNYCRVCALEILDTAQEDLDTLRRQLERVAA